MGGWNIPSICYIIIDNIQQNESKLDLRLYIKFERNLCPHYFPYIKGVKSGLEIDEILAFYTLEEKRIFSYCFIPIINILTY